MWKVRSFGRIEYWILCLIIITFCGCLSSFPGNKKGSSSNPAEVGEFIDVKIDDKTFKIAVLEVDWTGQSPLNRKDFEYVGIKVWIRYVDGDSPVTVDSFDFEAHPAPNGAWHDIFKGSVPLVTVYGRQGGKWWIQRPELNSGTMLPGDEAVGWVAFTVRKSKEFMISFEDSCYILIPNSSVKQL